MRWRGRRRASPASSSLGLSPGLSVGAVLGLALGLAMSSPAGAAPDEALLGQAQGYPAGANRVQAYQQRYLVGSFSAMDTLGPACTMAPAAEPLPLPRTAEEPRFRYRYDQRTLTLDDYLQRQRVTALLVLKDGQIVAERYNYQRTPAMRLLSNSMAKTVVALALVKALEEGHIKSFDDLAEAYAPALKDSLLGKTRLVNLLRMASGARHVEDYSATDDRARFNTTARRSGFADALREVEQRADPEGQRFNYAGIHTSALGLVLRGATGQSLCDYVAEKIWRPLGAEAAASWLLNPADQLELAQGGLNATVRDYARLGWMLANDGQVQGRSVVSREHLLDMSDAARQPEAFRPGRMDARGSRYLGYGYQVWLLPGSHRRFVLLGVYGQAIYVDPELKLVLVHTAVGADASGDASGNHLGVERDALFRGIVASYGRWKAAASRVRVRVGLGVGVDAAVAAGGAGLSLVDARAAGFPVADLPLAASMGCWVAASCTSSRAASAGAS